jgi:4-hydroxybenzoate polyprenyltransferase
MVLNDWNDRDHDAATRPERPLPSGAIRASTARNVGFALVLGAIAVATLISWRAAAWYGGLAALVLIYDLAGRGPWIGPLLLGLCRAANLGAGLAFVGWLEKPGLARPDYPIPEHAWMLASAYGAYVFCASRVARLEDASSDAVVGGAPRWWLLAAAVLLCSPAWIDAFDRVLRVHPLALLLCVSGAAPLAYTAVSTRTWTRAACGRATGQALRLLLVFTAAVALASRTGSTARSLAVAGAILGGYLVSSALRRVFPPT